MTERSAGASVCSNCSSASYVTATGLWHMTLTHAHTRSYTINSYTLNSHAHTCPVSVGLQARRMQRQRDREGEKTREEKGGGGGRELTRWRVRKALMEYDRYLSRDHGRPGCIAWSQRVTCPWWVAPSDGGESGPVVIGGADGRTGRGW